MTGPVWRGISDGGESDDHELLHDYACEVLGDELLDEMDGWVDQLGGFYEGDTVEW